nr:methylated-DNA--[protein]-cysteine S-methyltransferase [Paenibacillus senegalensis]
MFWSRVNYGEWEFALAATTRGLTYVGSPSMFDEEAGVWINRWYPGCRLIEDDHRCQPYIIQLLEYLQSERTLFELPLDWRGTPFQLAVWEALNDIPYGETRSYSDIAQQLGKPAAVRAVGTAIGANPILVIVPCHRVIAKNGALAGFRGGLAMKTKLLELESEGAKLLAAAESG